MLTQYPFVPLDCLVFGLPGTVQPRDGNRDGISVHIGTFRIVEYRGSENVTADPGKTTA